MALREQVGPYFGEYGGRFMPEALIRAIDELAAAYDAARVDPEFQSELAELHRSYTGRPSIITEVPRFAEHPVRPRMHRLHGRGRHGTPGAERRPHATARC
jgi:tryptophan synthase beta chain